MMSSMFCAVVMPAWIMFIVPHTLKVHDGELHMKEYDEEDECTKHHEGNPEDNTIGKQYHIVEEVSLKDADDFGDVCSDEHAWNIAEVRLEAMQKTPICPEWKPKSDD